MSWILDGIGEDLYDMHSINYLYTLVGTADFVCGLLFMRSFGSLVPVIFDTNNSRGI